MAGISQWHMAGVQAREGDSKGHVIPQLAHGETRNYAVHYPSKKASDRICFCPPLHLEVADALLKLCQENSSRSRADPQKLCQEKKKLWLRDGLPKAEERAASWSALPWTVFQNISLLLGGPPVEPAGQ